ncbi:MAG: type I DNA topoisomerase [Alphaproteobacteria bacterium]|nr:type I DNA topoisomerase [Alphaproteobacteria bacterium]
MNIVVVESPAKAKTINQYLGNDYKVLASYGHIRDLPNKKGSVIPDDNFLMKYEVQDDKKKQISAISKSITKGDTLWLATDADREGEAIAWHIHSFLKEKNKLKDVNIKRVIFNEITKNAILDAFNNPNTIDINMVDAYQARRALDYLMGFSLSPVLWKTLPRSKSAGRVQSVALKLICDRETEREKFSPKEYWTINSLFKKRDSEPFSANLTILNSNKLKKFDINNKILADSAVKKIIEVNNFNINSIQTKRVKNNPTAPFITSTLQQEASRKLGIGAKNTMRIAQSLYEGIEINGETIGLITYMRTDSVNLSDSAITEIRNLITKKYGDKYLPQSPNKYSKKSANAQEAHEAIRPTDINKLPDDIKTYLDERQRLLYELIWKRTISSQMESAEIDQVSINILSNQKDIGFRTSGSIIIFDGYKKIYTEDVDDNEQDDNKNNNIPKVVEGDSLNFSDVKSLQHFTEPPPRYTEASLVKKLEELGIGRPSTYASIVSVIKDKGYVKYEKRRFEPETKGRIVTAFLNGYFSNYIEENFTAKLEDQLDNISNGKENWKDTLQKWWLPFKSNIDDASSLRVRDVEKRIDNDLGPHFFPQSEDGSDPRKCPKCADGRLNIRYGRSGGFIGCSNHPVCDHTAQLVVGKGKESSKFEPITLGVNDNNLSITLRVGPYGPYVQAGETPEKGDKKALKPKRASIPKNIDIESVTLETALSMLALPRDIGLHPESGKMITANNGRFGPYVKHESTFASIKDDNDDVFTIGINRAIDLIIEKENNPSKRRKFTRKKTKK